MKTSEKIYQENSYLTELEAEVISCIKKDDFYEAILDKTIFYPHMSGGQPKDEGTINNIDVCDVQELGDEIVHILKDEISGKVKLNINFSKRFDYMQQHTGQHILSYAISHLFGGNTVGFHLSDNYTTIDLDISLTEDMIEQAEQLCNKIIYDNKIVVAKNYSYEEAMKLDLRKDPLKLDVLRIIEIQDCDISACGGTHVRNAGEIGIIKVTKTEKYKQGTRVEFLCGKRALGDYIIKNRNISALSSILTCRADMIMDNFEKIINENKQLKKDVNNLKNSINEYKARDLKTNAIEKENLKYIFSASDEDVKDLRYICSKITEDENYVAVMVSEADTGCSLVIGQSKNMNYDIKNIFEKCRVIMNGKGGGNNFLLQCTGDKSNGAECLKIAKDILFK
ncbi:DHHA1 domain-containing protein [Sedimentibacter sp. B4]|uniref:alanyl-tRNA editing protein n=1 Tax=Sedimentibacter sp. B4 TaxID=304766 RepID=UPI0002D7228A|nr:DHHA1 domain-containing protein [Sedimentibacter sp. B4]